jgi:hypothetical protein
MAEMVLNLPLSRGRHSSRFQKLFLQIAQPSEVNGWWRVTPEEYRPSTLFNFRCSVQGWARHRNLRAITRADGDGNLYVKMKPADMS